MAIKAGQIIHDANGTVVDRIQSGGVSNLNIPEEKVYELGNAKTVATVRDIPDLSFEMESLDVSTEIEALLLGLDPSSVDEGDELDFARAMPLDVLSPFKSSTAAFDVVKGLALPYLSLESATYRFGVRQNATQSFTLRGDSIYYIPGTPRWEDKALVDGTLTYNLASAALVYEEAGETIHVLGACVKNPATGAYRRLFHGTDFTTTANAVTLARDWFDEGYTRLHLVYGTAVAGNYPQAVHQGTGVKPAAVRGKDIDVYVSDGAATPSLLRWSGVQSFEVSRRVNLENDEEFGNYHFVAQDYDTAEVSGSIELKPADAADLWARIAQVANVAANRVVGAFTSTPLALELRVNDPDTGARLKTLHVPDARFQMPAVQGRVQQKLTVPFAFTSDSGDLRVFRGERP